MPEPREITEECRPRISPGGRREHTMKAIHFLIKPASSLCNLRCRYCFYEDIANNRSEKSMGIMTDATVQALVEDTFRTVSPGGTVSFAFQGGEPTVAGLDFFRQFVLQVRRLCPAGVNTTFSIQTNGTLLNQDWADFFRENRFLVGVSLDGYKDVHDLHRKDEKGEGNWTRVLKSVQLLKGNGVMVNALCVVTAQCARHPDRAYSGLKKLGFDYMQFIPCLDPIETARGAMPYSLTPEAYGGFLCRLFDLWYQDWSDGKYRSIRLFDDYVHLLLGDAPGTCATCGRCGSYFVVEGDGSVYPCDFFVLDQWKLGRLGEQSLAELAQGKTAQNFFQWGQEKPTECTCCRWRILCNGGCKNDWTNEPEPHNYFCPAFQRFFAYAEDRLLTIARAEQRARTQ